MDLHFASIAEIASQFRRRALSPVELTQWTLQRIERLEPHLHSFAHVSADLALAQAERAERDFAAGIDRGALQGIPVGVKDLLWAAGLPTAGGLKVYADHRPAEDATAVRRLIDAGAVLLGKHQTTEGAFSEYRPEVEPPINPWSPELWPGASSSGSGVAVAAGLSFGSLATDTGGSIRAPSAANGVTGLMPTWGRVSRHGLMPFAPSLDCIGPIARCAADVAVILAAIAGPDELDPTALREAPPDYATMLRQPLNSLRVGVDEHFNAEHCDANTADALKSTASLLGDLGVVRRSVRLPFTSAVVEAWTVLAAAGAAASHEDTYPPRAAQYGRALRGLLDAGRAFSGMEVVKAEGVRLNLRGRMAALFEEVDLLLLPAGPWSHIELESFRRSIADPAASNRGLACTAPLNMSGHPTLTLPGGLSPSGLPVAVQLAAPPLAEGLLLRVGDVLQQRTDWHARRPPL